MLTDAFENYAHALRILSESVASANRLLLIDPHEAAGNMENGLTNLLNSFHSLYDFARKDPRVKFDWYGVAETSLILSIRNARHHNVANRIRGLYYAHLQKKDPSLPLEYLFIDYPNTEDGGDTFDVPISWGDIILLIELMKGEGINRRSASAMLYEYLDGKTIDSYVEIYNIHKDNIYINITPLIVNSSKIFIPYIRPFIEPRSLESRLFASFFDHVFPADTHRHVVNRIKIFLPT